MITSNNKHFASYLKRHHYDNRSIYQFNFLTIYLATLIHWKQIFTLQFLALQWHLSLVNFSILMNVSQIMMLFVLFIANCVRSSVIQLNSNVTSMAVAIIKTKKYWKSKLATSICYPLEIFYDLYHNKCVGVRFQNLP